MSKSLNKVKTSNKKKDINANTNTNTTFLKQLNKDPVKFSLDTPIPELVNVISILSDAYYNTNTPLVTDAVFDLLLDALKERDPKNAQLKKIRATPNKDKVKLPCYMPSLDKIKPDTQDLTKWLDKYKGPYILSDKLDGVTALLYKSNNKVNLYTNSDENYGQNITHLIPHIIPDLVLEDLEDDICIRGELIISKDNFAKLNNKYKNGRNAIAGLVNSKHYSVELANLTDFVTYNILESELTQQEQLTELSKLKFLKVVEYKKLKNLTQDVLSSQLLERRKTSSYEIDGIVVADTSKSYANTKKNPEYMFAYKQVLAEQVGVTKVIKVKWEPSRHGYLKPTLDLEPIDLVGVTIKSATAFHAKYVVDNVLGPGAVVKIVRSGDVIPHILEVVKPSSSKKPQMPTIKYKWDDTKINILVDTDNASNASNDSNNTEEQETADMITTKLITDFFKKLSIKNISEGIVAKLVENGYNTVFLLIKAILNKPESLYDIQGLGEKIITKIKDNILTSLKKTNLASLMAASNCLGKGVSTTKSKLILEHYPNILTDKMTEQAMIDNIVQIDGFDTKTATLFSKNFPKFKQFFNKLAKLVDLSHLQNYKVVAKSNKLQDLKIVFTGFRDKDLEKTITDNGGKVSTSLSSNSSILIYNSTSITSSKYLKAKQLNVKTLTKDEFINKYKL